MKNTNKQIIFIELNEVPKQLIERYKKKSKRFSELIENFKLIETFATDKVHLSPWITWPTVHRGVDFDNHKIQNLGQDLSLINQKHRPIWEVLKDLNIGVGVYGSLHSSFLPKDFEEYDFYLPDPFSSHSRCHPNDLENIQKFQLDLTRKSGRNVERQFGGLKAFKVFHN